MDAVNYIGISIMAWFSEQFSIDRKAVKVAHFTDCHLFADKQACYFSAQSYQHLRQVFDELKEHSLDAIIFGGDLTQDHSAESYQVFYECVAQANFSCPVFWVPGNHDELSLLEGISKQHVSPIKHITNGKGADILLINSKGETPAGKVSQQHLDEVAEKLSQIQGKALVFCHHHPLPIDGYLDKHILTNGEALLSLLAQSEKVEAVFHGHVHHEYHHQYESIAVLSTPATSIQFSKHTPDWQQQNLGPAYRLIEFSEHKLSTSVIWLNNA